MTSTSTRRLSLPASAIAALLILADVWLLARHGWRGGFVVGGSVAVAIAAWFMLRARTRRGDGDRPEQAALRWGMPLLVATAAALLVYVAGGSRPVPAPLLAALPVVYLLLVHFGPRLKHRLRRWPIAIASATFSLAALGGVYLLGPMLHADWGLLDDHFIVRYHTPDLRLTLGNLPHHLWNDTPLGNAEERRLTPRFIPTHYTVHFIEKYLWGPSPGAWFAMRLVLLVVFATTCWLILARGLGWVAAGLFVAWMFTLPLWTDVWTRRSTTEVYTAAGIALCAWGLLAAWDARRPRTYRGRWSRTWPWLIVLLGAVLAMGSKENTLILMLPLYLTAVLLWRRRRLPPAGWVVTVLLTLFAVVIVQQTVSILRGIDTDLYGRDVSPGHRARVLVDGLWKVIQPVQPIDFVAAAVGLGAAAVGLRGSALGGRVVKLEARALGVFAACAALWVSQYVFYDGQWPTGIRYDFPGVLAVPLAIVAAAAFALKPLRAMGWDRRVVRAIRGGLIVGFVLLVASRDLRGLRHGASTAIDTNHIFNLCLDAIEEKAAAAPGRPILMVSWTPWDYEWVQSYYHFLTFRGVRNPMYLALLGFTPDSFPPASAERRLGVEMAEMSREGGRGFRPFAELASPDDAIMFKMSDDPVDLFRFPATAPPPAEGP